MRRRAPSASRFGSFLVVLGFLTVLGASFAVGVTMGRRWPGLLPSLGAAAAGAGRPGGGPGEVAGVPSRGPAGFRTPAPPPVLTFYRELTAPLAAPPPPARPERGERSVRSGRPAPDGLRPEPSVEARAPVAAARAPATETPPDRRFTIQVGAFKVREQADAMRARLAEAGHDAYVAALDGSTGARFRVRVGAFATRNEARQAAERLSRERQLAVYVTAR